MLRRGIAIGMPRNTSRPILLAELNDEDNQREKCDQDILDSSYLTTVDSMSDYNTQREALKLTKNERKYMPLAEVLNSEEYTKLKINIKFAHALG